MSRAIFFGIFLYFATMNVYHTIMTVEYHIQCNFHERDVSIRVGLSHFIYSVYSIAFAIVISKFKKLITIPDELKILRL